MAIYRVTRAVIHLERENSAVKVPTISRALSNVYKKMGYPGPWAVEVFSQELAALPLEEANRIAFQTTMAQFED